MALIVEDDYDQAIETSRYLADLGFEVVHFAWADQAREGIRGISAGVDLIILDRRLPEGELDEPVDATGDALLPALLERYPDSPIILFTGNTGLEHHQFATENRGRISVGIGDTSLDRVQSFDKSQTGKFDERVSKILDAIRRIEEIEVELAGESQLPLGHRRALQRLGRHFGGSLVRAVSLSGGKTGMPVWRCAVYSESGVKITTCIVKRSTSTKTPPVGGLHRILPAANVAAHITSVSGLCDGAHLVVMQDVGPTAISLFDVLRDSPSAALAHVRTIRALFETDDRGRSESRRLSVLGDHIWPFEEVAAALTDHGVNVPDAAGFVATSVVPQHGDLHGGNVLVANDGPILIDFDNGHDGSRATDPLVFFFSILFHPDSSIRGHKWPEVGQFESLGDKAFFDSCPAEDLMCEAWDWLVCSVETNRELWALTLVYAIKQTKYPDVQAEPRVLARAVELAAQAQRRLAPDTAHPSAGEGTAAQE